MKARVLWLLLALPGLLQAAARDLRDFDIPADEAPRAVTRFAQQAGVPVLFPYDLLQGRRTQPLQGRHEIGAGLDILLQGTGLVARSNWRGQLSLALASTNPPARARPATRPPAAAAAAAPFVMPVEELPEVAVTGSRIEREGMSSPTPVAAITRVELDTLGPTTLVDALAQLPHFLNSDTPQTQSFGTSAAAGASQLNLRGIGSIRTLVLLDGRRIVPSSRFGTVDIALLPRNLLQRIEVVTGGASAAYGSDAVSGVVNMVLDSDFRGLRAEMQAGTSELGDNDHRQAAIAWGGRIGEGASLLLSGEVARTDGIRGYQRRDWFDSWAAITNPDPAGPDELMLPNVHARGYTYGGLITSGPLAGTQFLPGGATAPFLAGNAVTPQTQSGGSGVDPAADLVWILPDQQRASAFARLSLQPGAAASGFVQLLASYTDYGFQKDPASLWGPWEATIYAGNPYLPQAIADRMQAEGIASFRLGRVGSDGELGNHRVSNRGEVVSITTGGDWQGEHWKLSGYYQYGRNQTDLRYAGVLRLDHIYRAIDAVADPEGRIVCRSTLSFPDDGCVPVNLFGQGSVTEEARAYVTEGSSAQQQDMREHVAEATLQRDVEWGGAAPLGLAAGLSWREESMRVAAHRYPAELQELRVPTAESQGYRGLPASYAGNANIFERTTELNLAGGYTVWEAFGEALVPLLRELPFARRLDANAALRIANYSGSGTIPAWKLGADWQIDTTVRLRATRSRDIRAGSLLERYDDGASGVTVVDKLLPGNPSYAVIARRLGNPAVDPEKSDTFTAGFVLTPPRWRGFSMSADYYDIRIHDAIAAPGVQTSIDLCAEGEQPYCGLIVRNETTGLITHVNNPVLNIAEARARGIDAELAWRGSVQWLGGEESLALRAFFNHNFENSTTGVTGSQIDRAGQTGLFGGAPRWQGTFSVAYRRGPLQLMVQQRLVSSGSYNATFGQEQIDQPRVDGAAYTNLRADYGFGRHGNAGVFAGIVNLFDEDPPRSGDWGFAGSLPTNEGLFDAVGRRFVVGVRYER